MKKLIVLLSIFSVSVSAQDVKVVKLLSTIDSTYKKIEKTVEKDSRYDYQYRFIPVQMFPFFCTDFKLKSKWDTVSFNNFNSSYFYRKDKNNSIELVVTALLWSRTIKGKEPISSHYILTQWFYGALSKEWTVKDSIVVNTKLVDKKNQVWSCE